ncbi:MAG TPA: T9SS type A sorting domain-containing protein [Bacteroidales bacterium]|nr:T9SS type A sorting domain-containing protein [Bacteroidales bacterium]
MLNNGILNIYGNGTFTGGSNFTITEGKLQIFGDFNVSGNNYLHLGNGYIEIGGNLYTTGSGKIYAESSNIIMQGSSWQIANGSSFIPGTCTVIFTNNNINISGGGGINQVNFYNVIIDSTAYVTTIVNLFIGNDITVENGGILSVNDANKIIDVVNNVNGESNIISINPYIIDAGYDNKTNIITLIFNMALEPVSAQTTSNYKIIDENNSIIIYPKSAKLISSSKSNKIVELSIDYSLEPDETYYLIANDIYSEINTKISKNHVKLLKNKQGNNPLPISLISFTGKKYNNSIILEWATASETNNDYFTIEKSTNTLDNWELIGTIKGAGNSNNILTYSYIDNNPINGIQYYRLKQTDYDGKYEYFKPIAVNYENYYQSKEITLYPNPAQNNVYIYLKNNDYEYYNVQIININGQIVTEVPYCTGNTQNIDISNIPYGSYILNVTTTDNINILQTKFIKAH